MTVSLPGVDYSSGHPGGAALAAAGMKFAARYLSHTDSKNISLAEATDLAAHGVSTVVVWETTANRAGAGRTAGIADAHDALAQATAAGMPSGRPVYFAVDWDADPATVDGYFQGVASVLGTARTGVYGGYRVVRHLLDAGLAKWAWQTAAWSGGRWDPRAVIRQPATGLRINGISCDRDTATATDYGQWMPGQTPTEEDVPLTDQEWTKLTGIVRTELADALAGLLDTRLPSVQDPKRTVKLRDHLRGAERYPLAQRTEASMAALTALVRGALPGGHVPTITEIQKAIADTVVHVDVNVTGTATPTA